MKLYDQKSGIRWFPQDEETDLDTLKKETPGLFAGTVVLIDDGAGSVYDWRYLDAMANYYGAEAGSTDEETFQNVLAKMAEPPYDAKTETDALNAQVSAFNGNAESDVAVAMMAQMRAAAKFAVQTADLTDAQALEVSSLYPKWETGKEYAAKVIVRYDGHLFRCAQAHTSSEQNNTTVASLWTQIDIQGGIEVWTQPTGAHNAYAKGAKVRHNGKVWESLVDGNVWEPGASGSESLWKETTE